MRRKVYATGMGIISGMGAGVEANTSALRSGRSGISKMEYLDSVYKNVFSVGEVKMSNSALMDIHGIRSGFCSRSFLLGLCAAKEAAEGRIGLFESDRIGVVSGTTVGGMDVTEECLNNDPSCAGGYSFLSVHDCGESTERIASALGLSGYVSTVSTACSSSANSIMHAAAMISSGLIDAALAGGADSLTKFTINGFNSLKILDYSLCNPFDENRNGLNIGEGAAYLFLESEESAEKHPADIICEIRGWANCCDAYHQTAISREGTGPQQSMKSALECAGLDASDIDYINLHGTGTENNDLAEGTAIEAVFSGSVPMYSSTKSFTGHTLGAAGAIEAVISIISIKNGCVFPNFNFKNQMKELQTCPVSMMSEGHYIKNIMSNSFGFGGNNSTLILSRVD